MNKILLYLVESGACLLVFYLLYSLVLKRENSFQYNRFYLLLTPLLSFIIPLLELPFLQQPEPLTIFVTQQLAPITISVNPEATAEVNLFNWRTGLLFLYSAGAAFFLFRLLRQLYQLHLFYRKTRANHFYWQNIRVHKTDGAQPTFSFWNCIYLDNSQALSEAETERVLLHEAVHIQQKHSLDILYLESIRVIFWFNLLLYLYQQAITSNHEFIADAAVLRTTTPETYARLLARQMLHRLKFSFGNYFNKSLTLKRMKMLQQTDRRPNNLKKLAVLPILGVLIFALSCADTETPLKKPTENLNQSQAESQINRDDEVFTFVEQNPVFPGGLEKMYAFIGNTMKYPEAAKKANLEGNVIAQFVITKEGKITDVQIVKSLSPETDAETKRVIALMPNWQPGKQDGKPLNVKYTLPIRFALNPSNSTGASNQLTPQNNPNEPIFTQVEQNPQFSGGLEKMYQFLGTNIKYPKAAVQANLEGMVVAKFQVTKAGKIKDIKIEKSLSPETDAEAKRVISMMPTWEPGKQNGKPVNVEYTLPIKFSLDAAKPQKAAQPLKTGFFWNNNRIYWKTSLQGNC
ncbi:M56 family metallopeptidase [Adhaeribacter pallidiroseus]|uniref:TonB C-terminal domain-containing protein n=1 Tax=Adhaeribacter pallidiroseus TaxID=2072847 RepID=A0A369QN50_9BACT|nr:M56 family metallopeptidase [Adhaeribacter pallidiroseus]RDC65105.1 hypothetical protein AHMF7616_03729 [Adhaeribacter pallidiroseus]